MLPLGDSDAYGTWSARPGGDTRGESWAELSFWMWGKKKRKKRGIPEGPGWAEQLAGKVSWPELPRHGLCQKTIKENIFRLTTSKIKKPHTTKFPKSKKKKRGERKAKTQDCLSHPSVCVAGGGVGAALCCVWKKRRQKDRKKEQVTHLRWLSAGERGGKKKSQILPEQNRPGGHVPYQIKPVCLCIWEKDHMGL